MPHVHLHCHTHYSLLDGASQIPPLVKRAKQLDMPALAITDHGNLYGAIEFYSECKQAGIKPIIGMEAYIAPGSRLERDAKGISEASYHLTLLAKNLTGYRNLIKLSSEAFLSGFYYRQRIDKELLLAHKEGLIVLSGCASGEFCELIRADKFDEATDLATWYAQNFGEDFYLEVMDNGWDEQLKCFDFIRDTGRHWGIPIVATSDSHYICAEDSKAHEVLLCINLGKTLSDDTRMAYTGDYSLRATEDMEHLFEPDDLQATLDIAEKCNVEIDFKTRHFPPFVPPEDKTHEQYLRELCERGLHERYGPAASTENIRKRLECELATICKMGFAGYFLVVADFVRFARDHSIPVSARGSACGSLVAYVLGLSIVDPIQHNLLFERFLDPSRSEPPDIDIDFCCEQRDAVLDYVRSKYGDDKVASIITFSTLAARAAIRDVGRVLGIDIPKVNKVIKLIPDEFQVTLDIALQKSTELRQLIAEDPEVSKLMDLARKLEGNNRNVGTHAAGVVIADKPLTEYIPLAKNGDQITTQWTMGDIEKVGLLKMDFLGLRNLTVLAKTLKLIDKPIDIERLALDDPAVYEMISRGETQGIFQLDTDSARAIVTKMKPDQFNDIIAIAALNRPATLSEGMVDEYIAVKHGRKQASYPHPAMQPILDPTYGVMVYQEQVMQILNVVGGIELTKAYTCIKMISKKKKEEIAKYEATFLAGAVQNGLTPDVAGQMWHLIKAFGGYGFNKSHSCAYAMIAYQTAWLKVHYPVQFMAALLSTEIDVADKLAEHMDEARRMGIVIVPPDVNQAEVEFGVRGNAVVCPLTIVRSVSARGAEAIKKAGPFTGLYDFCERVPSGSVNVTGLESLIKAGAFDSLGEKRAYYMHILPEAVSASERSRKHVKRGQRALIDLSKVGDPPHVGLLEWPNLEKLANEKYAMGFYLSGNPFSHYVEDFGDYCTHKVRDLATVPGGTDVIIGGILGGVKYNSTRKPTRKGNMRMAKFTIEDQTGQVPCVMFPDNLFDQSEIVLDDHICFVQAKVDHTYEDTGLIVHMVVPIKQAAKHFSRAILLKLPKGSCFAGDIPKRIAAAEKKYPGLDVKLETTGYDGSRLFIWSKS